MMYVVKQLIFVSVLCGEEIICTVCGCACVFVSVCRQHKHDGVSALSLGSPADEESGEGDLCL